MTADTARRVVTIDVPVERILSVNRTNGHGWGSFLSHKRDVFKATNGAWLEADRPTFTHARVVIRCVFPSGGRRDPQNYVGADTVKQVLDTLTRCGCWHDDRPPWMVIERVECLYQKGRSNVVLTIEEAQHVPD